MSFKVWQQAERGGLTVTGFFGGADRGPCLQFDAGGATSTRDRFAQLDRGEVERLRNSLTEWLRESRRSEQ